MANIDLGSVELNTLDIEQLERVKMILDINQIQQSIKESQASIEKMRADSERADREHQAMLVKIQADAERAEKENRFYPMLPVFLAVMGSGVLATVITLLFS